MFDYGEARADENEDMEDEDLVDESLHIISGIGGPGSLKTGLGPF